MSSEINIGPCLPISKQGSRICFLEALTESWISLHLSYRHPQASCSDLMQEHRAGPNQHVPQPQGVWPSIFGNGSRRENEQGLA